VERIQGSLLHLHKSYPPPCWDKWSPMAIVCYKSTVREVSLPETRPLPSVQTFAECKISGTRQRASLPSATLGKEKHTVNSSFAEYHTLGKEKHSAKNFLPSAKHSAKVDTRQTSARQLTAWVFAECLVEDTRQNIHIFSLFCPKFFLLSSYILLNNICNLRSFIEVSAIFRQFILFY
jgi:hypothetical protein